MKTLPEPAHKYGYTSTQLHEIFTDEQFEKFCKWMDGQTVAVDEETGMGVVYADDLERFMRALPVAD